MRGRHDFERRQIIRQREAHGRPAIRVGPHFRVVIRGRAEFFAQLNQLHHFGHVEAAAALPLALFAVIALPHDVAAELRGQHAKRARTIEIIERIRRFVADEVQNADIHDRDDDFGLLPRAARVFDVKLNFHLFAGAIFFLVRRRRDAQPPLRRIDGQFRVADFKARLAEIKLVFNLIVGDARLHQHYADVGVRNVFRLNRHVNRVRAPFDGFNPTVNNPFALDGDEGFDRFVGRFDENVRRVAGLVFFGVRHDFNVIVIRTHPRGIARSDRVEVIFGLNGVPSAVRAIRLDFVIADFIEVQRQRLRRVRACHRKFLDDFRMLLGFPVQPPAVSGAAHGFPPDAADPHGVILPGQRLFIRRNRDGLHRKIAVHGGKETRRFQARVIFAAMRDDLLPVRNLPLVRVRDRRLDGVGIRAGISVFQRVIERIFALVIELDALLRHAAAPIPVG